MVILQEENTEVAINGKPCCLQYRLLSEIVEGRTGYGVSAANLTTGEQAHVPDALLHQADGRRLLSMLAAGGVTPATLWDVVSDFVAEL